jgi:hypothetical protein
MAVSFNPGTEAFVKLVSPSTKFARREPALAFPTFSEGISEMIMLLPLLWVRSPLARLS